MKSTYHLGLYMIIAAVIIVAIVSWISYYKKKEREKKLYNSFDDFVDQNKLTIDKKQTLNKNIIGLDRLNGKLVFINNSTVPKEAHLINLADLAACNLKKERDDKKGNISEIYLLCIFKDPIQPELKLPVYNSSSDELYKMMRLSKKASYWEKTINIFREVPPSSVSTQ